MNMEEIWKHHNTPATKQQWKQWLLRGMSANKVLVTVFWDKRSIIFIEYVKKLRAIIGKYWLNLIEPLQRRFEKEITARAQVFV